MFDIALKNQVKFTYVLADTWFSSNETMEYIVSKKKHFIVAVKDNRLVALSEKEKALGHFKNLSSLLLGENEVVRCFFKGMDMSVSLIKQVFQNKDDSTGVLSLPQVMRKLTSPPSRRSTTNGGKSRNFINRSNRTPDFPNHRRKLSQLKAITFSLRFIRFSNSNFYQSKLK